MFYLTHQERKALLLVAAVILAASLIRYGANHHLDKKQDEPLAGERSSLSYPINVNSATSSQLEALPGVGRVIAERIVEFRRDNGPFADKQSLMGVKGIGEKKLKAFQDHIVF